MGHLATSNLQLRSLVVVIALESGGLYISMALDGLYFNGIYGTIPHCVPMPRSFGIEMKNKYIEKTFDF